MREYTFIPLQTGDERCIEASLSLYSESIIASLTLHASTANTVYSRLMGQDEIYLQVLAASGEGSERRNAKKVLNLLKKGKHWVLVSLLLGNVITNETLPIVLDRSLGGGWPAVLSSTVLIGMSNQTFLTARRPKFL